MCFRLRSLIQSQFQSRSRIPSMSKKRFPSTSKKRLPSSSRVTATTTRWISPPKKSHTFPLHFDPVPLRKIHHGFIEVTKRVARRRPEEKKASHMIITGRENYDKDILTRTAGSSFVSSKTLVYSYTQLRATIFCLTLPFSEGSIRRVQTSKNVVPYVSILAHSALK